MDMDNRFPTSKELQLIFAHLGRTDLLNIRLVCKDWNQDCVNFFHMSTSSKFRLTLDHKNSEEYIQFIYSNWVPLDDQQIQPQPVMPIHLKFKIPDEDDDDSDSENECFGDWRRNAERFEEFASILTKLQDLFGPDCVKDLTLVYPKPYYVGFVEDLVKILWDLSSGLEKLAMKMDCCEFPGDDDCIVFPKVKYLSFEWFKANPLQELATFTGRNTPWNLIQGCPNLETLILGGEIYKNDLNHWPSDLPFPPVGVKSLELGHFPTDWLLKKMQEHPSLPVLQKLELSHEFPISGYNDDEHIEEIRQCREILRLFSPSLQTLSMPLTFPCGLRFLLRNNGSVYKIPFPVFPALRNFTITNVQTSTGEQKIKIDPGSFPALEYISIPFDIDLNKGSGIIQFLRVKSLSLEYDLYEDYDDDDDEDDDYSDGDDGKDCPKMLSQIKHFQRIFPNISTIQFRNSDENESGLLFGSLIKQHLKTYLQLPEASKIQVLEMCGFVQNYLGKVFEEMHHTPRLVLENVRRNPLLDDQLQKALKKLTGSIGFGPEVRINEEIRTRHDDHDPNRNGPDFCIVTTSAEQVKSLFQLKNVRKIRLELNEKTRNSFIDACKYIREPQATAYRKALDGPIKLYLNEMMENFPRLEEIEVSSHMFGRTAADRAQRIQKIRGKFPGLRIYVI